MIRGYGDYVTRAHQLHQRLQKKQEDDVLNHEYKLKNKEIAA
jgi:hypothetical protein